MKRWPPIIWPAMAFASLLLLMGLGAGEDWAMASGVVLEVVVIGLAARLSLASRRGRPLPSWFPVLLGCLALFYLGSGLAAVVAGTRYLPIVLLAALIPTAAVLLMLATVRGTSSPVAEARTPAGDASEYSDVQAGIPPR